MRIRREKKGNSSWRAVAPKPLFEVQGSEHCARRQRDGAGFVLCAVPRHIVSQEGQFDRLRTLIMGAAAICSLAISLPQCLHLIASNRIASAQ